MNQERDYSAIAFVSGKGGVGKTTLAANVAWLISQAPARVLLIDLDFQNLGCTGLIGSWYRLEESYALALIQADQEPQNQPPSLTRITENLQFLPAGLVAQTEERRDAFPDDPQDLYARLSELLGNLHKSCSIDCFVLDCHGGIDATSIASAGVCDYTMVVTEADTVTFAGTLGLVDSYYQQYRFSDREPKVEYIVNRIPAKYKWKDLDELYKKYLKKQLGRFTKSKSVLSYIPAENYIADSFGDYPFQVELAPTAIFTRKLELILYSLFNHSRPNLISEKACGKFSKERYRRKINKRVISNEAKARNTVFASYGLASFYIVLILPLFFLVGFLSGFSENSEYRDSVLLGGVTVGSVLLGIPLYIFLIVAMFRLFRHFREHLKFQKCFFCVLPEGERSLWRRLKLWKLRLFYYPLAFLVFLAFFYAFALIVSGLVLVISYIAGL